MEPEFTPEEVLDGWFTATFIYQVLGPVLLTLIAVALKTSGLLLVSTPWVYVLLPLMVSLAVGIGLIALIMVVKLFLKAFGK
jgi:hypothetical protein